MHRPTGIVGFVASFLLVLVACGGNDGPDLIDPPVATTLQLSPSDVTLDALGATLELTATVEDQRGTVMTGQELDWSSSRESVATVVDGLVTAVGNGSTEISASVGAARATASIVVRQESETVEVTPSAAALVALDDTIRFQAQVLDREGKRIDDADIMWTSSDSAVATVDSSGLVQAVENGTATISATSGTVGSTATVSVDQAPASIGFSPTAATLEPIGDTTRVSANVLDAGGSPIRDAAVSWASAAPDIVAVESGLITAIWVGSADIMATSESVSANLPVTVRSSIAFDSNRDGNSEIWSMQADGSEPIQLTNVGNSDIHPRWSPDGSRVVFQSYRDGNWEIYVMDADGSNQINLTNDPASDQFPDWSPDGSRIAYTSSRDGDSEILIMDADGSNVIPITDNEVSDRAPAWSPDGSRIAFTSTRTGNYEVHTMNADGSGVINVSNDPAIDLFPDWSPDGSRIAFISNRDGNQEIYVMWRDGSDQVNLTQHTASDLYPAWSPHGAWIAFESNRDGNDEIYVMKADGSNPMNISTDPSFDGSPAWAR